MPRRGFPSSSSTFRWASEPRDAGRLEEQVETGFKGRNHSRRPLEGLPADVVVGQVQAAQGAQ